MKSGSLDVEYVSALEFGSIMCDPSHPCEGRVSPMALCGSALLCAITRERYAHAPATTGSGAVHLAARDSRGCMATL
jgi:hypothetical protein